MAARLKPISLFNKTFKNNELQTWWVDEFGNSLRLEKNTYQIIKNDPAIREMPRICTDLFGYRSFEETIKISKSISIVDGYLYLYGYDEYWRCFDKNKNRVSPLSANLDLILKIMEYVDYQYKDVKDEFVTYKLPNKDIENIIKEYC